MEFGQTGMMFGQDNSIGIEAMSINQVVASPRARQKQKERAGIMCETGAGYGAKSAILIRD
jgi:hypothetical protein